MRTEIENWELLIIRQCKKNKPSIRNIRRIYAHIRAVEFKYVKNDFKYINRALLKICMDFDLIRDYSEFILENINPDKNKWWNGPVKSYDETLCDELISTIMLAEVKKFPRYPRSAWFRNTYPEN